jgi:hypothetical protein
MELKEPGAVVEWGQIWGDVVDHTFSHLQQSCTLVASGCHILHYMSNLKKGDHFVLTETVSHYRKNRLLT